MQKNDRDWKPQWRRLWLSSLLSLADLELQRERWLNDKITNPVWTYVEFICGYFDDCLMGDDYPSLINRGWVRSNEYEAIKDFHHVLEGYNPPAGDYDHQSILDDQKWLSITHIGKHAMEELRALIDDTAEQEIFDKRLYAVPLTAADFTWPH
jgi:hypothetical protein